MSNPLSAWDVVYKEMTSDQREKMGEHLKSVLNKSIDECNKRLIEGVQKAATEAYANLIANPWPQIVKDNSSGYELISAILEQCWQRLLQSNPADLPYYKVEELVTAWRKAYPSQWKEIVDKEAGKQVEEFEKWKTVARL